MNRRNFLKLLVFELLVVVLLFSLFSFSNSITGSSFLVPGNSVGANCFRVCGCDSVCYERFCSSHFDEVRCLEEIELRCSGE